MFTLGGGLHVCPNVLDHGAMASSAVSRCNHHTHSFPNTASDAGSVPQTTKIVQADFGAGEEQCSLPLCFPLPATLFV